MGTLSFRVTEGAKVYPTPTGPVTAFHGLDLEVHRGETVSLLGPSGCGKSTIATLLCQAGGGLLADDLLRVDPSGETVRVWGGGYELRLREGARELATSVAGTRRGTADHRTGLTPREVVSESPRDLALIALPRLHRSPSQRVEVTRLARADALLQILAAPRLLGWSERSLVQRRFRSVADLVSRVPVTRLDLPWQRPFGDGFSDAVAAELSSVLTAWR